MPRYLTAALALSMVSVAKPGLGEVPRVATDILPVHSLVARIMAGVGVPDVLLPADASPHHHALRPSDADQLERADIIFQIGDALTPWLSDPVATLATGAEVVALLEAPDTTRLAYRELVIFAEHDDHHDDDHDDGHDDHGHDDHDDDGHDDHDDGHDHGHDSVDPHAWLDPDNGRAWLDIIAAELARIDPEHAGLYRDNAREGKLEIEAAVADIEALVAPSRGTGFVVFHDAYQYFEAHFDIKATGAITLGDGASPSPARLAEIRDAVAEQAIVCVFSEPQFDPGLVAAIMDDTDARTAVIDPVGRTLPPGPDLYPALLRGVAEAMADCLDSA